MKNLISEELYKLVHKRGTRYVPLVLFLAMLAIGLMARNSFYAPWYITSAFAGTEWVLIIIIIACATTISMEYEYGTIKHLVIQDKGRSKIFLSKFIVIILYDVYLHLLAFLFTFPIKLLTYGSKYPFSYVYNNNQTIFTILVIDCLIDLLGSVIIIGAIFLLACAAKSAAVAVASGITLVFIGQAISLMLVKNAAQIFPLIRWNPFNMLNMQNEWANPDYYRLTQLTIKQLIVGNVIYSILFLGLAFFTFKHKRI